MNRQEAARIIKAIGKHAIETHLTDPGDILDATVMAVEALVPKPDEVTGLVPCGCGGKVDVAFYPGWHGVPDRYMVDCFNCHVGTKPCQTAEQAKAAWNTAMGVKTLKQACPYCSWIDPERLEEDEVDGPLNYCRVCGRDLRR